MVRYFFLDFCWYGTSDVIYYLCLLIIGEVLNTTKQESYVTSLGSEMQFQLQTVRACEMFGRY